MINKNDYINLSQDILNRRFIDACRKNNLDLVKYLLTSKELKENVSIHSINDMGFRWACKNGSLEIVKYLLTSCELKDKANIHAEHDWGFIYASTEKKIEVIQFLIFDMNIEKTEAIKKYLTKNPNEQIENMFNLRKLNTSLKKELNSDKINNKRVKL